MFLAMIVWLVMTVFPSIKVLGIIACGAAAFIAFCSLLAYAEDSYGFLAFAKKTVKWLVAAILIAGITPSTETSWYMVGAYATQTIVQSETGKELASDSLDVLKSLIKKSKQYIDEADLKELPKPKEQAKGERT